MLNKITFVALTVCTSFSQASFSEANQCHAKGKECSSDFDCCDPFVCGYNGKCQPCAHDGDACNMSIRCCWMNDAGTHFLECSAEAHAGGTC